VDLLEAKSRIAEALVESIFRRARFEVHPYRPETLPLRFGREDFSPDFRVTPPPARAADGELLVEVKYRPSIEQFVSVENQRGDRSALFAARRHWPTLYFVLVTERPEPGRSCFQALSLAALRSGEPIRTADIVDLKELRIFRHNLEDHEQLIRRIFALLSGAPA
jgi:hypothetical protein